MLGAEMKSTAHRPLGLERLFTISTDNCSVLSVEMTCECGTIVTRSVIVSISDVMFKHTLCSYSWVTSTQVAILHIQLKRTLSSSLRLKPCLHHVPVHVCVSLCICTSAKNSPHACVCAYVCVK